MVSYGAPICYACSKFNKSKETCSAYPKGIPKEIYFKGGNCKKSKVKKATKKPPVAKKRKRK